MGIRERATKYKQQADALSSCKTHEELQEAMRPLVGRRAVILLIMMIIEAVSVSQDWGEYESNEVILGLVLTNICVAFIVWVSCLGLLFLLNLFLLHTFAIFACLKGLISLTLFIYILAYYKSWPKEYNWTLITNLIFGLLYLVLAWLGYTAVESYKAVRDRENKEEYDPLLESQQ